MGAFCLRLFPGDFGKDLNTPIKDPVSQGPFFYITQNQATTYTWPSQILNMEPFIYHRTALAIKFMIGDMMFDYGYQFYQIWVGYGCPAQSFDNHPIPKPEKMQICNLCLNHLFLQGPFLNQSALFYHVHRDA